MKAWECSGRGSCITVEQMSSAECLHLFTEIKFKGRISEGHPNGTVNECPALATVRKSPHVVFSVMASGHLELFNKEVCGAN